MERFLDLRNIHPAGIGEHDALPYPLEQPDTEVQFNLADLTADRALTQIELVCSSRKAAVLGCGYKSRQAVDRRKFASLQPTLRDKDKSVATNRKTAACYNSRRPGPFRRRKYLRCKCLGRSCINQNDFLHGAATVTMRPFVAPLRRHQALWRENRPVGCSNVASIVRKQVAFR